MCMYFLEQIKFKFNSYSIEQHVLTCIDLPNLRVSYADTSIQNANIKKEFRRNNRTHWQVILDSTVNPPKVAKLNDPLCLPINAAGKLRGRYVHMYASYFTYQSMDQKLIHETLDCVIPYFLTSLSDFIFTLSVHIG